MTVFRLFFKILRRSISAIAMYIGIFLFIFSMGAANFKESMGDVDVPIQKVSITILDYDESRVSKALSDYIADRSDIVNFDNTDKESLMDELYGGVIDYVLIIPEGFQENPAQDDSDSTLRLTTYVSDNASKTEYVDTMIENFMANWDFTKALYGKEPTEGDLDRALKMQRDVLDIRVKSRLLSGENADILTGFRFFLIFLDYIMVAIPFLIFGPPIIVMEQSIMKRRDVASGYSPGKRAAQLLLAAYVCHALIWVLMVVISFAMSSFSLIYEPAVPYMLISSFIHMLATGSMSLFLAHLFPSESAMSFLSTTMSLLLAFSSGIFISDEFLWKPFHRFSMLFPSYWDVQNQKNVQSLLVGGRSMTPYYRNLLVIGVMLLVGFLATLLIRHINARKLEEA